MTIIRKLNGSFSFKVYRKPTSNDKFLSFASYNPDTHKASVIKALDDRANKLCSEEHLKEETVNIDNALKKNGYSERFIQKQRKRTR